MKHFVSKIAALSLIAAAGSALAGLPPPTPQQVAEQAAKKAKADADAEKAKQLLAASMDSVAARWRSNAGGKGWKVNAPTAVVTPPPAAPAPSAVKVVAPVAGGMVSGTLPATPAVIAKGALPAPATASAGGISVPPVQADPAHAKAEKMPPSGSAAQGAAAGKAPAAKAAPAKQEPKR